MSYEPIVIVGAGPGGLVLAATLLRHGVGCRVLERDAHPDARRQGGSLDLHPASGQRALRAAGLEAAFAAVARPSGEELHLLDPGGTVLVHQPPASGTDGRPEVDRAALRTLLLDALPAGTVVWDTRVQGAERLADGRRRLHLSTGDDSRVRSSREPLEAGLVVGADGARSRVRPLLTDAGPTYSGSGYVELDVPELDRRHPEVAALVGAGALWVLGGSTNLTAQRLGDGSVRVSVGLVVAREDAPGTAAALRRRFAGWDPRLVDLVTSAEPGWDFRPVEVLPVGLRWPTTAGVTLLGDAAHLMPPVGEGANQALLDGALLAEALIERPHDQAGAVAAYEAEMFARTAEVARESAAMAARLQAPTAAVDLARLFGAVTT